MINVDMKQLALFKRLAEEKHFAKTATAFFMTASAVTRSIQRLEETLGCQLFLRQGRQLTLTPAAEALYVFAEQTLNELAFLQQAITIEQKGLTGELKIFASVTASYSILPNLFETFRSHYPDVEIKLHTGDQADAIERIEAGLEDVAVSAKPTHLPSGVLFQSISFTPLKFIMPKVGEVNRLVKQQLAQQAYLDPLVLPMIVAEKGAVRDHFDAWAAESSEQGQIYAQVTGHEAIISMVALGCGIGLVPQVVIDNSPLKDKIGIIQGAPELPIVDIGLCARQEKLELPVVKHFWQTATACVAKET